MPKFKVGDKVRIARSSQYCKSSNSNTNPRNVNGVVTINDHHGDYEYEIKWDNGHINVYKETDLLLVETTSKPTLTAADLVIGGKYVPKSKLGGIDDLEDSSSWKRGKKQGFLYYTGKDEDDFCFWYEYSGEVVGDFYLPSDMALYEDDMVVDVDFIRHGHHAAGAELRAKLEKAFPQVFVEEVPFTKELLMEIHRDACPEWKKKLETKFPKHFEQEILHKTGNRYKHKGILKSDYILSHIGDNMVVLICLKEGNRWVKPVKVRDTQAVTHAEWCEITSDQHEDFTLIK